MGVFLQRACFGRTNHVLWTVAALAQQTPEAAAPAAAAAAAARSTPVTPRGC